MSFISVFDVMGPNMIGPSSSHTAGAAYLSCPENDRRPVKESRHPVRLLQKLTMVTVLNRALLGGIMGFSTDDMRIRNSFDIAHEKGLKFPFTPNEQETDIHPNTVDIRMENEKARK